jgi:hypothetical protein
MNGDEHQQRAALRQRLLEQRQRIDEELQQLDAPPQGLAAQVLDTPAILHADHRRPGKRICMYRTEPQTTVAWSGDQWKCLQHMMSGSVPAVYSWKCDLLQLLDQSHMQAAVAAAAPPAAVAAAAAATPMRLQTAAAPPPPTAAAAPAAVAAAAAAATPMRLQTAAAPPPPTAVAVTLVLHAPGTLLRHDAGRSITDTPIRLQRPPQNAITPAAQPVITLMLQAAHPGVPQLDTHMRNVGHAGSSRELRQPAIGQSPAAAAAPAAVSNPGLVPGTAGSGVGIGGSQSRTLPVILPRDALSYVRIRHVLPEMAGFFYKVRRQQGKGHFNGLGDPRVVDCDHIMAGMLRALAAVARSISPPQLCDHTMATGHAAGLQNQWAQAASALCNAYTLDQADAEQAMHILMPLVYRPHPDSAGNAPPPPAWSDSPCLLVARQQQAVQQNPAATL